MADQKFSPLDVDAVVREYDAYRHSVTDARRRRKPDEVTRLVEKFDQRQRIQVRSAKQQKDPNDTRKLLVTIATQLADGCELRYEVRKYLADALIATATNPASGARYFGLTKPKHRPSSTEWRDVQIAFRVLELSQTMPIYESTKPEPWAIDVAAKEFEVRIDVATKAWKKNGGDAKAFLESREKTNST